MMIPLFQIVQLDSHAAKARDLLAHVHVRYVTFTFSWTLSKTSYFFRFFHVDVILKQEINPQFLFHMWASKNPSTVLFSSMEVAKNLQHEHHLYPVHSYPTLK